MGNLFNTVLNMEEMNSQGIAAIIPAAGLSTRMNGFKPLLKIGSKSIVEHVIGLFESCGVSDIVTVVGHRAEELIPFVCRTSARFVVNPNFQDGMFSSIQAGVKELHQTCDGFFLLPVDTPLVRPSTLESLLQAFRDESSPLICYPQFNSRRGHPPLISSSLISEILSFEGQGGMRAFLSKYNSQARDIAVDDAYIRLDADTRADLAILREAY